MPCLRQLGDRGTGVLVHELVELGVVLSSVDLLTVRHLLVDRHRRIEVNVRNMLIELSHGLWHRVSPCEIGLGVIHDDVTTPMPI